MKTSIKTSEEALIMELENLYCSERKLQVGLIKLLHSIHSENLQNILQLYIDSAEHKRLKADRVFSYLNHEPMACHTSVVDEMINETQNRIHFTQDSRFRDLLLITCMQRINSYQMCAYKACLRYAEELDLENPVELLKTIILWEEKMDKKLTELASQEFDSNGKIISA